MDSKPPGTDVNQIHITSLSHIRGQPHVVEQLQLHLSAHFNMRATANTATSFGPILFSGPPGTGKTMTARAVHAELGNLEFIETNGVALNKKQTLQWLPHPTIQRVIEPYLIREDLITKGKSSQRIITDKGRRHLETTAWSIP